MYTLIFIIFALFVLSGVVATVREKYEDEELLQIGDRMQTINDNGRLPSGTDVIVTFICEKSEEVYVRNADSNYCCWYKIGDLRKI